MEMPGSRKRTDVKNVDDDVKTPRPPIADATAPRWLPNLLTLMQLTLELELPRHRRWPALQAHVLFGYISPRCRPQPGDPVHQQPESHMFLRPWEKAVLTPSTPCHTPPLPPPNSWPSGAQSRLRCRPHNKQQPMHPPNVAPKCSILPPQVSTILILNMAAWYQTHPTTNANMPTGAESGSHHHSSSSYPNPL